MTLASSPKRPPALSILSTNVASTSASASTSALEGDSEDEEKSTSSSSPLDVEEFADDLGISEDMAVLQKLRRNVHNNLKLRPIKSSQTLRPTRKSPSPPPSPSPTLSAYYTPTTELRATPLSPSFLFNHTPRAVRTFASLQSPTSNSPVATGSIAEQLFAASTSNVAQLQATSPQSPSVSRQPITFSAEQLLARLAPSVPSPAASPSPPPTNPQQPIAISAEQLLARLTPNVPRQPLVLDSRPQHAFLESRIPQSVNIAVPSLILKRSIRKPGTGISSLESLRTYITTDEGRDIWDDIMRPEGSWNGDIVLVDESELASNFLPILSPLVTGSVCYLEGGIDAAKRCDPVRIVSSEPMIIVNGDHDNFLPPPTSTKPSFILDTSSGMRTNMPEIETISSSPDESFSESRRSSFTDTTSPSPSPPPQRLKFPMRNNNNARKGSVPNLRRLDTSSFDSGPPKLRVQTMGRSRAATLMAPPTAGLPKRAPSPSRLAIGSPPDTAKPSLVDAPPSSEAYPAFAVSTIIPGFLYLGPELTERQHVDALKAVGVRRILNTAIECHDDQGLDLTQNFERYIRVPMRDTVEEDNVTIAVRQVCGIIDDARLHSAPVYVHCKAGKSRSVTAVLAYLIHANHWTLSRAYAFVVERRKGVSPNIGFVSELMTFEEQELGAKSMGVVQPPPPPPPSSSREPSESSDAEGPSLVHLNPNGPPSTAGPAQTEFGSGSSSRRPGIGGRMRESMPAMTSEALNTLNESLNAGISLPPLQETEVRDADGKRYRHARRAPFDRVTLQPGRRVSKAGLESTWSDMDGL